MIAHGAGGARFKAINAPVIDAVRVPPSASITSQSIQMVRSPSRFKSMAVRSDRPIRRWISSVRPERLPDEASRMVRVDVARGIMEYSDVIQPFPLFFMKLGTVSSTLAVQITRVRPTSINTDPSAEEIK
jgi:hypothetical protein